LPPVRWRWTAMIAGAVSFAAGVTPRISEVAKKCRAGLGRIQPGAIAASFRSGVGYFALMV
ncbi:MAG: hypothetical protein ACM32G_03145, partial [Betaproteobacteria bacterium]